MEFVLFFWMCLCLLYPYFYALVNAFIFHRFPHVLTSFTEFYDTSLNFLEKFVIVQVFILFFNCMLSFMFMYIAPVIVFSCWNLSDYLLFEEDPFFTILAVVMSVVFLDIFSAKNLANIISMFYAFQVIWLFQSFSILLVIMLLLIFFLYFYLLCMAINSILKFECFDIRMYSEMLDDLRANPMYQYMRNYISEIIIGWYFWRLVSPFFIVLMSFPFIWMFHNGLWVHHLKYFDWGQWLQYVEISVIIFCLIIPFVSYTREVGKLWKNLYKNMK